MNGRVLLSVLVIMSAITEDPGGQLPADADAAIRQLYDRQETFIRAWRHLPKLTADDRPIRPWLFRVARNLLIDADRAARSRPVIVEAPPDEDAGTDSGLQQVLDRELVFAALQHLSPAHRTVLVKTFYNGGSLAAVANELGIPQGTARSRLHYALRALRQQLREYDAVAC